MFVLYSTSEQNRHDGRRVHNRMRQLGINCAQLPLCTPDTHCGNLLQIPVNIPSWTTGRRPTHLTRYAPEHHHFKQPPLRHPAATLHADDRFATPKRPHQTAIVDIEYGASPICRHSRRAVDTNASWARGAGDPPISSVHCFSPAGAVLYYTSLI